MREIVNDIAAVDRAIGWMALQMILAAEEKRWYPALSALFIMTEQVLRWATDAKKEETLDYLITRAGTEGLITATEMDTLHLFRVCRNQYLHANFHGNAFELNGLLYSINEEETAEVVYQALGPACLSVVKRLVT